MRKACKKNKKIKKWKECERLEVSPFSRQTPSISSKPRVSLSLWLPVLQIKLHTLGLKAELQRGTTFRRVSLEELLHDL